MRIAKLRGWVGFFSLLGILLAAYFQYPFSGCSYLKIGFLRLVCPVGFIEATLATKSIIWELVPGFVVVCALLFVFGRAYCSWFCPAAQAGNKAVGFIGKFLPPSFMKGFRLKWRRVRAKISDKLKLDFRDGAALFLGAAVGIAVFGYPFFCLFCPIGVVSRNLIELATHYSLRLELVMLALPLFLGLIFRSGWKCMCPVGTLRGFITKSNRSLIPLKNVAQCNGCRKCEKVCPSGQSPFLNIIDPAKCIKCFECVDECPQKALSVTPWKGRGQNN